MKKFVSGIVLSSLTVAAVLSQRAFAQITNVTEAKAKMFAASAAYERFMGRWSRQLAPAYVTFAGVKEWRSGTRHRHWNRIACRSGGSEHARDRDRRR